MEIKRDRQFVWAIYFIGFDEATSGGEAIEPRVGFERVETTRDPQQQIEDAELAAALRGGELLSIVEEDDAAKAADLAGIFAKDILRMR